MRKAPYVMELVGFPVIHVLFFLLDGWSITRVIVTAQKNYIENFAIQERNCFGDGKNQIDCKTISEGRGGICIPYLQEFQPSTFVLRRRTPQVIRHAVTVWLGVYFGLEWLTNIWRNLGWKSFNIWASPWRFWAYIKSDIR